MLYEVTGYARLTGNGPDHLLPTDVIVALNARSAIAAWIDRVVASGFPRGFVFVTSVREV